MAAIKNEKIKEEAPKRHVAISRPPEKDTASLLHWPHRDILEELFWTFLSTPLVLKDVVIEWRARGSIQPFLHHSM
jgi:hypothetical protein